MTIFHLIFCRIVRNKAAEKAKHVHHQQQQSQNTGTASGGGGGSNGVTGNNGVSPGNVSVITHATAQSHQQTQLTPGNGAGVEQRTGGYSINGILGIQHTTDPNGNSIKRKRIDDHGELIDLIVFSSD